MRRAGDRLRAMAAHGCDAQTMQRVIDPLVADLQLEHARALRHGQRWKARAIRAAATLALLRIMVAKMHWIPNDPGPVMRTAGYSVAATVVITMLFAVPTFLNPMGPRAYYVYVIPQLVELAIPIGVAVGIVSALAGTALSSRVKTGVVALAVVGAAAAFVTAGWISPAGNHAARVASGAALDNLDNLDAWAPAELTLGQLNARIHRAADFGLSPDVGYLRFLLQNYYGRWAFPAASLTLTLCLLAVAGFPKAGRKLLGVSAFVLIVGYETLAMLATRLSQDNTVSAPLAAWLPNLVLFLAALTIAMLGRRSRASVSL